jgi:hypothetical protein
MIDAVSAQLLLMNIINFQILRVAGQLQNETNNRKLLWRVTNILSPRYGDLIYLRIW